MKQITQVCKQTSALRCNVITMMHSCSQLLTMQVHVKCVCRWVQNNTLCSTDQHQEIIHHLHRTRKNMSHDVSISV